MMVMKCVGDITTPYEGYPSSALGAYGWAVVAVLPVLAIVLSKCDLLGRKE